MQTSIFLKQESEKEKIQGGRCLSGGGGWEERVHRSEAIDHVLTGLGGGDIDTH